MRCVRGSSPFTATIILKATEGFELEARGSAELEALGSAQARLLETLEQLGTARKPGQRLVVAFSGGGDSTALLWGLRQLSATDGNELLASHLDHGLDEGSRERAVRARELAEEIGVEMLGERIEVGPLRLSGESFEAASRRIRYRFLERVRRHHRAAWIVTAHHLDDQLETLLVRLLRGTGLRGLACIRAEHGRVVRPLLDLPRDLLAKALDEAGLEPVSDPTNLDLRPLRNRIRRRLPALLAEDPTLARKAGRLAECALAAAAALDRRLERLLDLEGDGVARPGQPGSNLSLTRLCALPTELRPWGLALLHRRSGAPYPPRRSARNELFRQLKQGAGLGCDAGGGWRWRARGDRLFVLREPAERPGFSYTLEIPGEL